MRRVHFFGGGIIGKEIIIYDTPDTNLLLAPLDFNTFVEKEGKGYLKVPKLKMLTLSDAGRFALKGYSFDNGSDIAEYAMEYGFQLNAISYLSLVGSIMIGVRCTGSFRYKRNQLSDKELEMVDRYDDITKQLLANQNFKGAICASAPDSDRVKAMFYVEGFGSKPSVLPERGVITLSPEGAVLEIVLE